MTLSCKSIRECDYYIKYLFDNYRDVKSYTRYPPNLNHYNRHLVREINNFKVSQKKQYLMQSKFKEEDQVPPSQLGWLNADNGRACNWFWSIYCNNILNIITNTNIRIAANNEERFKAILNSFIEGENNIEEQLEIMNKRKIEWEKIYSLKVIIPWFDINNKAQEAWIWDYLQKSHQDDISDYAWFPLNKEDEGNAIIALFDVMTLENPDRVNLIILKMKKAWSQKKYRDKNKNKKQVSIGMTSETKSNLDELAKIKGLKITDIIENLIEKEYENCTSKQY